MALNPNAVCPISGNLLPRSSNCPSEIPITNKIIYKQALTTRSTQRMMRGCETLKKYPNTSGIKTIANPNNIRPPTTLDLSYSVIKITLFFHTIFILQAVLFYGKFAKLSA